MADFSPTSGYWGSLEQLGKQAITPSLSSNASDLNVPGTDKVPFPKPKPSITNASTTQPSPELNPNPSIGSTIPINEQQDTSTFDQLGHMLDESWARRAFLISDATLDDGFDARNRYWSSASVKFTDTRLGSNFGINSRPQYTRYCDIRDKGRLSGRKDVTLTDTTGNYGMGRYYSEAIDDPSQTIYMKFGVPQFNSLTNFLSRAFDGQATVLARTGRLTSWWYDIGKTAGTIGLVVTFPRVALAIITGQVISAAFRRPTSKFYTMKDTMPQYWMTVNNLVGALTVNKGIFPKVFDPDEGERPGQPFKLDEAYIKEFTEMLPDIFRGAGYFDMFAIANKAIRLANKLQDDEYKQLNNSTASDWTGYLEKMMTGDGTHGTYISDQDGDPSLLAIINQMLKWDLFTDKDDDPTVSSGRVEVNPKIDVSSTDGTEWKDKSHYDKLVEFMNAEFRTGSGWATFKVDHTGSVSESFGNAVTESDLSQKLNSTSSQNREARFSFANGNLGDGFIASTLEGIASATSQLVIGAIDGMTIGGGSLLAGLGGSGFIDIPKHWQSSTATLPKSTYTMQLISPYGNPFSQMINIYIPLCMILAGTLPLSTGKASYTSPYLCQIFDKGRCQIQLGMIESLSITRGTSSLPFDRKGNALAIDVSFSVVDLSSIMHMPVSSGKLSDKVTGVDMTLDEDNILSDYLAVLAGQDIYTQTNGIEKAKLAFSKTILGIQQLTSPALHASMIHDSATQGFLSYVTFGIPSLVEKFTRNRMGYMGVNG